MSTIATSEFPKKGLRIALVGPVPPPSGGMANQTLQLKKLLLNEGIAVEMIAVNRAHHPLIEPLKGLRALFRLIPYLGHLWRACGKVDLIHIMANSGWSWHLFAAPAIWIAHFRKVPVIVNYRGGEAGNFFEKSSSWIKPSLDRVSMIIVPSGFLAAVFKAHGFGAQIVPNIIDLSRFFAEPGRSCPNSIQAPRLLVARNLELIYDNASALQAFRIVHDALPLARLTIAGSGPELAALQELARSMHLESVVSFTGRIDTHDMPQLYRDADIVLNPTLADNMPNSVLEALASGVPVVSTDVGGIPFLLQHEKTALLVPVKNPAAMAAAVFSLLESPERVAKLRKAGVESVSQYTWSQVRQRLLAVYAEVLADQKSRIHSKPAESTIEQ